MRKYERALCLGWAVSVFVIVPSVWGGAVVDEHALFAEATEPVAGAGLIGEWEPVRALSVSLPLEGVFARQGMGDFMLSLVTSAARYTDVVILHDEEELQTVARVNAGVRAVDEALLERVHFVPARVGTVWLRDHGPVFARDQASGPGALVVLDSVYRDARFESRVEQERLVSGEDSPAYRKMAADLMKRHKDDTTPVYLAQYLRQQVAAGPVQLSRPPAQIWGGDIETDGRGNVFVSTETLTMHGGKQAELETILRDYYGAKRVVYLEPLPGPTVKHLDMFFKVMDADTFFLASYDHEEAGVGAGEYARYLHGEIKAVLARDEARLREAFPGRKVVHIPMPAVVTPTREQVVREYRDLFYLQKLLHDTPSLREHLARATDPNDRAEVERKLTERAVEQYHIEFKAEPGSNAERELVDKLIRENSTTTLDEAVRNYAPREVIYKTFLNSVQIDGAYGKAVLVPDYSPDERNPQAAMVRMRRDVQDAYGEAMPDAEVVFINCDAVIGLCGALHCVTVTVPDIQR
ncbi:MAG: agmatine deiminase family protein [Phycisphaerales bacterium]